MKKYLIRAVKYFFYLLILLVLVIGGLVAFDVVEGDISTMFVNGYDSLWQIALVALFFALVYPKVAFRTLKARIPGSAEQVDPIVVSVMSDRSFALESKGDGQMSFRRTSRFTRALKMWEDRITFVKTATGYDVEGLAKEIVRVISAIEAKGREEI